MAYTSHLPKTVHLSVAGLAVIVMLLAGCGEGSQMGRPENTGEAVQRTDQLMDAGRSALSAELQFGDGINNDRSRCEDGNGQSYVERSLELVGADPSKFAEYQSKIRAFWDQHGFHIKSERAATGLAIAENGDGFTMKLRTNDLGKAYLGVSSPCV